MMPRIKAQELLDDAKAAGLAFGSYEKEDAEKMHRELRERAAGSRRERPRKATPAVMASMGIGAAAPPSQKALNDG